MLAWLFAGHLFGDFLFQTKWMADHKETKMVPLLTHSAVYTVAVWLVSLACGGLDWRSVLLVFVSHLLLDNRKFVRWWCKHITHSFPSQMLMMITDQAWHIAALVFASMLDTFLKGAL